MQGAIFELEEIKLWQEILKELDEMQMKISDTAFKNKEK